MYKLARYCRSTLISQSRSRNQTLRGWESYSMNVSSNFSPYSSIDFDLTLSPATSNTHVIESSFARELCESMPNIAFSAQPDQPLNEISSIAHLSYSCDSVMNQLVDDLSDTDEISSIAAESDCYISDIGDLDDSLADCGDPLHKQSSFFNTQSVRENMNSILKKFFSFMSSSLEKLYHFGQKVMDMFYYEIPTDMKKSPGHIISDELSPKTAPRFTSTNKWLPCPALNNTV